MFRQVLAEFRQKLIAKTPAETILTCRNFFDLPKPFYICRNYLVLSKHVEKWIFYMFT